MERKMINAQTWIHFIGKSYYSLNAFIKESKVLGINRAIAPNIFRQMNFGDIIFLAQKDGASSKVFGFFVFSEIMGLTSEAVRKLKESNTVQLVDSNSYKVERGCGSYVVTGSYQIMDPIKVITLLKGLPDDELGRIMIGGAFFELNHAGINADYVLTEIPFRQGFRKFDFVSFKQYFDLAYVGGGINRHVKVPGQFYTTETRVSRSSLETTRFWEIKDYQLN